MLELIRHDAIHELRLARPPVNALDPELLRALHAAIKAAPDDGARALILSGRPGMFSAGLDVPTLLGLDRATLGEVWRDFFGICGALAASPIPTVAALTGHSPAGGAVIALYCDYRIMARGEFRIGLNEVQVGLPVPDAIQYALRRLLGAHRAERLLVAGTMLESAAAHEIGLVDELADADDVVARALLWLTQLLKYPPKAQAETRRMARADLAALYDDPSKLPIEGFLDGWFDPEAQQVLTALVAKLKSRG
ncbi:MAG: enoyl-CoA hydratase/isomerase family protein [Dokdonella sp.]